MFNNFKNSLWLIVITSYVCDVFNTHTHSIVPIFILGAGTVGSVPHIVTGTVVTLLSHRSISLVPSLALLARFSGSVIVVNGGVSHTTSAVLAFIAIIHPTFQGFVSKYGWVPKLPSLTGITCHRSSVEIIFVNGAYIAIFTDIGGWDIERFYWAVHACVIIRYPEVRCSTV